ncbi:MAG TPA: DMT family transporter [Kofleriaceae bacterium]|jgi:drug/metabolite transporter (DMT)-like permease|nr:DMT family transporter [Kofleriaceae bacterium]
MPAIATLFILIWSTGFIVAKEVARVADPNLFLAVRCGLAGLLYLGISGVSRARWPAWREVPKHLVAGMLLQGGYLGGTYWAVGQGLPPGVMALLGALQPLLTAVLAIAVLREIPTWRTWVGLLLGVGGVALVLGPGVATRGGGGMPPAVFVVAIAAVLSLTAGTVLQKTSIAGADLRTSSVLQNAGAAAMVGTLALVRGESRWITGPLLWGTLAWAALVLSGLGTLLLVWMVRRGRAANVASLMLLAPPLAATESYFLFDDRLTAVQIAGFAIALAGVFLCNPAQASRAPGPTGR